MNTFSIGEAIHFGWDTFKKRPWFFIGISVAMFVIYGALSWVTDPAQHNPASFMPFVAIAASMVLGVVIEMMLINLALKSHDNVETVQFSDAWSKLPFWNYLGAKILAAIIVIIGLILLIIPGVIVALTLMFSNYLVVDKNLGPIEALKESVRITKGHRWQLLLLVLVIAGINILGMLALFVGLLVSIPVSILTMVHVYRMLEHKASEVAAVSV